VGGKMRDAEKLVLWLYEGADELLKAHYLLDEYGVPRERADSDAEMTLAARIYYLMSEGVDDGD